VASQKVKKGTAEVDAAFLAEMEGWRDVLARNIALRNDGLDARDLNFAVQATIDRLVFLRICEDRGIEPYGTLQSLLNVEHVYRCLAELFQRADDRYNSGLFHFTVERDRGEPPDELTLGLTIDDKPLKEILRSLYFPESPYEFSVLPVEILGHVYEQFLGKVIRLTKGGQAKVEEKPEVRKAGGVYYTPSYVVDYIVRNTVGALLWGETRRTPLAPREESSPTTSGTGKSLSRSERSTGAMTPKEAAKLRILDPACGSGSFLLGAYQFLLDWHLDWYVRNGPEKHARGRHPQLYRSAADDWRLTTAEKKRILLSNIYGTDIDAQAVEVTKLSLLLKVLEGESKEAVNNQLRLLHERVLPDLAGNIKCGNSLIGLDFYNGHQLSLLDDEERHRINAFNWHDKKHGFGQIMAASGFDAVIGNPPYGAAADACQLGYYRENYETSAGSCDSFALFMERAASLLRARGLLGMIVQSAFVSAPSMSGLREMVIAKFRPLAFVSMPYDVFAAYVDTVIVVARRLEGQQTLRDFTCVPVHLTVFPPRYKIETVDDFAPFSKKADAAAWLRRGHNEFLVTLSGTEHAAIDKLHASGSRFQDVADIQRGVTPYHLSTQKPKKNPARAFDGTVRRYKLEEGRRAFLQYDESLAEFKPPRYFRGPRLLLRELISRQFRLQAVFVDRDFVTNKSMQSVLVKEEGYHPYYLLGLLNSRLMSWYFLASHSVGRRDDFPKIVLKQTRELPFCTIDFSDRGDKARHDRMVRMVEAMLALHQKAAKTRTPQDRTPIERQIVATDRQIDQLVYELYGLSDDEIAAVEGVAEE
jgi:hypothetical protein